MTAAEFQTTMDDFQELSPPEQGRFLSILNFDDLTAEQTQEILAVYGAIIQ